MAKITKILLCCVVVLILNVKMNAQLSGIYNVPTNYPTLSAAFVALNLQGVSGPVFIEVNAGYTEIAPAAGYSIIATGTALNPIVIRKTGTGVNPLITAYSGGTGTPASAVQDGVLRFIGCDYMTIDGIDINDPNPSNPSTMEFGIGFFKASTSNGCQNNTIQNCVISLKIINNATGSGPAADGSRGINVVNSLYTSQTSVVIPVSFAGTNSNNKFYANTLKNTNIGIALIGYAAPSPFNLADDGNDVGGSNLFQGNTITNFGGAGAATNAAAGIRTLAQYGFNASYNLLNNNDGSGANHVTALRGIFLNTAPSANLITTNNTITLNGTGTTGQVSAIENLAGATAANNTVSISNNLIVNCTYTTNTTGSFFGVFNNGASASYLEINNNKFTGINTRATTGSNYLIYNTGAAPNAISMNSNRIENCVNATTGSGAYYNIFNNVVSSALLSISNTTLSNNASSTSTGATYLIFNASTTSNSITLSNNVINDCIYSINSTGGFYGIYNNGASLASLEMSVNTFLNHRVNAFSGPTHLIYNTAAVAGSILMNTNLVSGSTNSASSSGSYYAIYNNAASSSILSIVNNTFTANNYAATNGSVHLVFNGGAITNTFITNSLDNNLISNCSFSASAGGPFLGVCNSAVTSTNLSLSNNTVTAIGWLAAGSVKHMIYNTGAVNSVLNLNNNLIANCSSTNNTTGTFNGITNAATCSVALNITNNTFTNINNRATTGGIYLMYNTGALPSGVITMSSNVVSGFTNVATGSADFYGMYTSGTTFSSLQLTNNTFTNVNTVSATGICNYIQNAGAVSTAINSVNLSNNFISSCSSSISSTGTFFGIYNNSASCLNLLMNANTFTNVFLSAVNGANHLIYNRGALTNTFSSVNMDNNLVANCSHSATAGAGFYCIWNNGVTTTLTSMMNNTITASVWTSTFATRYLISNWGVAVNSANISNNLISNCSHPNNSTGFFYGIYNNNNSAVSSGALTISNNTFTNNLSTATTGETHFINNSGVTTNTFSSITITNNRSSFTSATVIGGGTFFNIYNNTASFSNLNISQNMFTNSAITSSTGSIFFIYNRGVGGNLFTAVTMTNNLLSDITHSNIANGVFYGIVNGGSPTTTCTLLAMNNNTFMNSVSSGTGGQITLMNNTCPVTTSASISNNLFSNFTNTLTTSGSFFAINSNGNSSLGDLAITNNTFTNLVSTASAASRYLIYNSGGIANSILLTNNLISNCSHSISGTGSLHGIYNNSSTSGLNLIISNNTFTNNFSSSTTGSTYLIINAGLLTNTITNITIANNSVVNFTNIATAGPFYGMYNSGFTAVNLAITTNTLSNITASVAGANQLLLFNNGRVLGDLSFTDNLITGYTSNLNTGGTFYGIGNGANFANQNSPVNFSVTNNRFVNTSLNASTGSIYYINNSGTNSNTITSVVISNNLFSNLSNSISATGNWFGIYNTAISSGNFSSNTNTFTNIVATTTASSRYMIYNGGVILNSADFSNNLVSNFTSTVNTTGSYFGINNAGNSRGNVSITNNAILNHTLTATSGSVQVFLNSGVTTNSMNITNNFVSNMSHTATTSGGFLGVYNNAGGSSNVNLSSNTFTNLNLYSSSGPMYFILSRAAVAGTVGLFSISNNLAGACTYSSSSGQFCGVFNSGTPFANLGITNNTVTNVVATTTTGSRCFILSTGAGSVSMNVSDNVMSGFTSTANTSGSFFGVQNIGAQLGDLTINNNRILNHTLTATTGSAFVVYNIGSVNNNISIANNLASDFTHSATSSGGFLGYYNNAASSASLGIVSNSLINTFFYTSTGATHYLYNRGATSSSIASITLSNNLISASTHSANSGPFYGVFNSATSFGILDVAGNIFDNINSTTSTSGRYFLYNSGAGSSAINIRNNRVSNYLSSFNTTGVFYDAVNTGTCAGNLDIIGNTFSVQTLPLTAAAAYMINNTALVTGSVSISNNIISSLSHTSTSGILYGIYNNAPSCGNLSITSNTLNTISTTNSVNIKYLIYNTSTSSLNIDINNNAVSNYSAPLNTTGNYAGIFNTGRAQGDFSASDNSFRNLLVPATTGTCYGVYNTGMVSGVSSINNNLLANVTNSSVAAGTFYGIYNLASNSTALSMSGNSFSAIAVFVPTVAVYLVYNNGNPTLTINSINLDNNSATNFTNTLGSGAFYGIFNIIPSTSLSMSGNTFSNCVSSTTNSLRYMVYNTGSASSNMIFSGNSVSNYTSALNTAANFYGIYNVAFCSGSLNMNNNLFRNNSLESTTGVNYLVYNTASITNSIGMNGNTVANNSNSVVTTGNFYGVHNAGVTNQLSMSNNTFSNNISAATSPDTYLIYNTAAVTNSISMLGNILGYGFTNNSSEYAGTLYNIYNTGGTASTTLAASNNTFTGYSFPGLAGSGNIYFIHNINNNSRYDVLGNTWTNLSLNHNGNEYLIYNPSSTSAQLNINNNTVSGYTRTANAAALYMYYSNGSSPATCTQIFSGNNFSNISAATIGTGSFYGIYSIDGTGSSYPKKTAFNNSISNINYSGLGFFYGYYFDLLGDASGTGSSVYSNTLSTVSWNGPLYGFYIGGNVSPAFAANVYSNTIFNLNTSGTTAYIYGAHLLGGGNGLNFYKNKISNLNSTGILGLADGINVSTAVNTSIHNNLIGNINAPFSSAANTVNGINIIAGARVNVRYNTVNLSAVSAGTSFASNALYAATSVSLDLRNNILINTSTPTGSAGAVAYRRTTPSMSNYSAASNNNVFYTGIPSGNRLIFTDGTSSYQTLPAYQAFVSPRDNNAVSESTPFLSTVGTNFNFLHVDLTVPSLTESKALNISGIADDFDGQVRQGNPGYVGSGTAPDIGADEFNQMLTPCNVASAGTVIIPSSPVKCEGETIYLLSSGYTAAGDLVHQWKFSTTAGGPYTNVTGGIGTNQTAYTSASLSPGTFYYVLVTSCTINLTSGTSNEVTVTVNAAPSASASVLNPTLCAGQNLILSGSSNTGVNYIWTGPNNFTTTVQSPTVSGSISNSSGTYTLIVSDANCTSTPVYVNATVSANPPTFSLTPSSASICIGNSQTITASIPITNPTLNFGSQTYQNTASGYPAPYSLYYGGQKMQLLILAGELAAAGFTTGTPIHSVQFPVVALGSNWSSSVFDCQNFRVGIKLTPATVLTAFETGLSNVVAPINFTPAVGYNNIHNFSSPFIWDGSSNIVIETAFSNSIAGTSANFVTQYNSPTGFQSTLVYRADFANVSAIAAATGSNINIGFVRPDFKLNGTQVGTYSWSPSNGLSSTSGISVLANPTVSSVYSISLSEGQCSSTSTVVLNIIPIPTVNISSTSASVCIGNTATLTASGATTYTWITNSTNTNIVVAPFVSTTYSVTGSNPSCPDATASIQIISLPTLTISALAAPPVLCLGGSSTLTVSGASNYTWTGGSNATSLVVMPNTTANYTVLAYNGQGCWTTRSLNVKINSLPEVSISPSSATICVGESVTFEASGVFSFTWIPGNSNSPIFAVSPINTGVYTVVGSDLNNCVNTASVEVTVKACTVLDAVLSNGNGISVFPNPSSGAITASFPFEGEKEIKVENSLGALVYQIKTLSGSEIIDLSKFAKGIYFVKITTQNFSGTYKLIID